MLANVVVRRFDLSLRSGSKKIFNEKKNERKWSTLKTISFFGCKWLKKTPTLRYGFLVAPFALSVSPTAQIIVTINCNELDSKPNFIWIRPPMWASCGDDPAGVNRFAYRVVWADVPRPPTWMSGEPGDVTNTAGLSVRRRSNSEREVLFWIFLLAVNSIRKKNIWTFLEVKSNLNSV